MSTVVLGSFEWDEDKAATNVEKHDVTFEEAALALADEMSVYLGDALDPERVNVICMLNLSLYFVVCIELTERTRIISARKATSHEARIYTQGPPS